MALVHKVTLQGYIVIKLCINKQRQLISMKMMLETIMNFYEEVLLKPLLKIKEKIPSYDNLHLIFVFSIITLFGIYSKTRKIINIDIDSDSAFWGLLHYDIWHNRNYDFSGYFYVDSAFGLIPNRLIEAPLQILLNFDPIALKISWITIFILIVIVFSYIIYLVTNDVTKALVFSAIYSNISISSNAQDFFILAHNGTSLLCGILTIVIIFMLFKMRKINYKKKFSISFIILILIMIGTLSNPLLIIIFIAPITLGYIIFYKQKNIFLSAFFLLANIISYIAYKYKFSGIIKTIIPNPPIFLKYMSSGITPLDQINQNIVFFFEGIAWLLNDNLALLWYEPNFLSLATLILIILLAVCTFYYLIKEEKPKALFLNRFVLLSIFTLFCAYVFSGMAQSLATTRYLVFIPIAIIILIALSYTPSNRIFTIVVILFLAISITGNYYHLQTMETNPNRIQHELIEYLHDNNLHYGYGDYWDSNILTYLSKFDIIVRPIYISKIGSIRPHNWLQNTNWYIYPPEADVFIILKEKRIPYSFIQTDLRKLITINPPKEVLQFQEYTIYVWNGSDFSSPFFITMDGFSIQSGVGYKDYASPTNETIFISSRLTNQSGYLAYGPYISLLPGHYTIKYEIKTENFSQPDDHIFTVDIYSTYVDENPPTHVTDAQRRVYGNEVVEGDYTNIQLNVSINTYNPNRLIEFRVFQPLNGDLYVKNIDIIKNE